MWSALRAGDAGADDYGKKQARDEGPGLIVAQERIRRMKDVLVRLRGYCHAPRPQMVMDRNAR
jgi:hypothetical protein